MESTSLRQLLQTICYSSPWKYVLFWKFQQHNQMLLTLEEGYCQTPQERNSAEGISDNIRYNESHRFSSPKDKYKCNNEDMGTDPVELALAYMSSAQHTLGDGIVGEVAHNGIYYWTSADCMSSGALSFKHETVLLVPVLPHGVLQLGSLEKVAEDQAVVANIKNMFFAFQELLGNFNLVSENMQLPFNSAPSIMCPMAKNVMSDRTMNGIKCEKPNEIFSISQPYHMFSMDQITQSNRAENSGGIYLDDVLKVSTSSIENDAKVLSIHSAEEHEGLVPLCQRFNSNMIGNENSFFNFPHTGEQFQSVNDNMAALGSFTTNIVSCSDWVVGTKSPVYKDFDNLDTFFSFPEDCELHKALGSTTMGSHSKFSRNSPPLAEEEYNFSNLISSGNFNGYTEPAVLETRGPIMKDDNEHLLEFLCAGADFSLEKDVSDSFSNIKSSTTTLQSAFPKQQCQSERRPLVVDDTEQQSCVTSSVMDRVRKASGISSPSASSFQSMTSALIGEENQKKGRPHTHPRKGSKLSNDSKRRSKAVDNQKARPRDRQLIQDRLKELRDLVPDGVKCSIDGLLDKTIQHMLFLRSVTDQADKLRQVVHREADQEKNWKSANRNDSQKGTSWAYDLGSEQQLCPIVVEDLGCPGTMLIEMVCGDHGNFLDIAEVIRRLELTILKGGMENHSGSTWARFIVEVPRGFHRLDIFWPLMQLLQ
ncbi:transcription factor LHW isoform X2 [Daucus carota subsp. sativus]|uniref:transcription factor LHW isoform X2 n=1 Tax=Daucus carota subsp. sativus TaxID=79200 RepID=UPI0007B20765